MSSHMMVLAWDEPDLSAAQRLVLLALAECSDREGRNAFRSERTIAEHASLAIRTVKTCIKYLRDDRGLISVQERPTNRRSTTYQLHLPGGAGNAPRAVASGGARIAPLGVIPRGQTVHAWGAKPDRAYKDDPVFEPVNPDVVRLLAKAAVEILSKMPDIPEGQLIAAVGRWATARRMPSDIETVCQAVARARSGEKGAA